MEASQHIREWLPAQDEDDETKLGLCVVLVKDGFDVYLTMSLIRDMLKQAFEDSSDALLAADCQGAWQAVAQFEQQIQCFCDFVMNDLELYEVMQKSTATSKETCIVQLRPNGGGGNDEHMEQGNNEHQTQQERPPQQPPSSSSLRRRRRSLLGNSDKNQQSQQPRARRRSLEIADIKSFDGAAAPASFEDETAKYEQSFDTIEYYTDDDDECLDDAPFDEEIVENNEKGFDTLEYGEETLDYDEETIENFDKSIDTLEYNEEMENLATLEYQEAELVEEDIFRCALDEKISESAVDSEACALNDDVDENETAPLSLQPRYLGTQEGFAHEHGGGEKPMPPMPPTPSLPPHLSCDPSPPAQFDPSVLASSRTGISSIVSNDDDEDANTREDIREDSDPLLQFDPSVITCRIPGTGNSIVSDEDEIDADTHEVIREESDPCLQFDTPVVECSSNGTGTSIDSNEDDDDADIHEVIREDSDPYLQFDPSVVACTSPGTRIVSNEHVNDVDTQDVTCDDTEGKPPTPSRGKRIRKMFGSLIRRSSKLHIDQSEDVVRSPSRTVDENGQEQSCSKKLHAAGKLRGPEEVNKEVSSQVISQPTLSSSGLTRQSGQAMSPEQPLPWASKPKEQSVEQAFQCDAVAPPSPSNRANRFNGMVRSLSLKALSPRRESKRKSMTNIESPMPPPSYKDSEPKELHLGSPPDQQEFQSDDEAPPSPTNQANRFHEIFKGLVSHSPKQEQVDCSMSPLHTDENVTSTLPAPPLSIFKSTKYHVPDEGKQMTEEYQFQSPPAKKVSFKLPPDHRESPSSGRCRRRPGSPPRRKTASRPGSPQRERQNGARARAVGKGVRDGSPARERKNGARAVLKGVRQGSPPRQRQNRARAVSKGGSKGVGDPIRWDLRVRFGSPVRKVYNKPLRHDDCVLVPDFFGPTSDWSMYYELLLEIRQLQDRNITGSSLIQCPADVGKHLVCTTPMKCKTFKEVCKKVCTYFDIKLETVQFTLNWYRDNTDIQKPRHDEEAYENDKPSICNITVGISFGAERELSLEKQESFGNASDKNKLGTRISIPQRNNCVCTIGRDVNIRFKNGLVQGENDTGGSIAIILWGQVQNVKDENGSPAQLKRDPVP